MKKKSEFKAEISAKVSEFLVSRGCNETGDVMMGSIVASILVSELEEHFGVQFEDDEAGALRTTHQIIEAVLDKVLSLHEPDDEISQNLLEIVTELCDEQPKEPLHLNDEWEKIEGRPTIDKLLNSISMMFEVFLDPQDFIGITTLRPIYDAIVEENE